jgi:enterochelin esterase-like enzyme
MLLLFSAACEPLAPDPEGPSQIIVTATFTPPPPASPTPIATAVIEQIPPTLTNTPVPNPTATLADCLEDSGQVLDNTFSSTIAGQEITYRIYLPPCYYLNAKRYPYVILLHGSNEEGYGFAQWTDDLGVHNAMDEGIRDFARPLSHMVLVMPEGGELQETDTFEAGASWEDVILNEMIPELEQRWCVWTSPNGRAIGGVSRGGLWATSIALRHPDMFAAVGGHSPRFAPDNAPPSHNPLDLAFSLSPNTSLRLYLDVANNDNVAENVGLFANILRSNDVLFDYDISATGGHDNDYWSSKIRDYLNFYGERWPNDPGLYPGCL